MTARTTRDYNEIQRRQWRVTLPLTAAIFLFYAALIAILILIVSAGMRFFRGSTRLLSWGATSRALIIGGVLALFLALVQYLDARRNGAKFILRQLGGQPADPGDRYHKEFADTVDEIRIAAGLPRVECVVLPTLAINALALIKADGTPVVAVTEGLLSESTRDELQAVAAHELSHIIRGDTFFITLVCALADAFERLRDSLSPETDEPSEEARAGGSVVGGSFLVGAAAGLSAVVMRLLSTLISREREFLADAAAVELCRAPEALARAILKAKLKNAFVGDFSLTYSPLLIVPSDPFCENEGLRGRLFSTHPPAMTRVERLAQMAHKSRADIIQEVWDIQQNRNDHRRMLLSEEEFQERAHPSSADDGERPAAEKVWLVRNDRGQWLGPLTLTELFRNPYFLMSATVRNIPEGIEAEASEFPALREAARREARQKPLSGTGNNLCPRCRVPLGDFFYEGVPVKICRTCLGKLVDARAIERILARKEFTFSPQLLKKAENAQRQFLTNPIRAQKVKDRSSTAIACPACGYRMASRPFNYQYFLPVEKCLSCYKIWFDADELEILQILVEKAQAFRSPGGDQSNSRSES